MRIATWNVNSLKARLPRVEEWLEYARPDVLCMQETKLADDAFPVMPFQALGYEVAFHGEGRWNGVAIASRVGLDDVVAGFSPEPEEGPAEARLMSATCGGVRVASLYVPNGREVGTEHYDASSSGWPGSRRWLDDHHQPSERLALCGDFNIAPDRPRRLRPEEVRRRHPREPAGARGPAGRCSSGASSTASASSTTTPRLFTWWDYRAGDFHSGRGMRIDLMLVSEPLAKQITWGLVDRNARKGKQGVPSDHAPVLLDIDV